MRCDEKLMFYTLFIKYCPANKNLPDIGIPFSLWHCLYIKAQSTTAAGATAVCTGILFCGFASGKAAPSTFQPAAFSYSAEPPTAVRSPQRSRRRSPALFCHIYWRGECEKSHANFIDSTHRA